MTTTKRDQAIEAYNEAADLLAQHARAVSRYRRLLLEAYEQGANMREIAHEMGVTKSRVYKMLEAAREDQDR